MPDLSHLWQRFLRATALLLGLALGVAATVFAYSNTGPVDIGWSVFHLNAIPLWAAVIVPLVIVLAVGTLYHWYNSLHHFTEHMRHRRRVHELEAELKAMRSHVDQLLEMPDQSRTARAPAPAALVAETPALPEPLPAEPAVSNGDEQTSRKTRKRTTAAILAETTPVAAPPSAEPTAEPPAETEPREETTAQA